MESAAGRAARAKKIVRQLARMYPDARCALHFESPLELLIATVLSAQCTDKRVNMVTPALFRRYPTAKAYASARAHELERMIASTGFFRNKTKSIMAACQRIVDEHHGVVPGTMEELVKLPGVGRKTANVLLGNAFGTPGLTVDTHMIRVNRRLGLTRHTDAVKIEEDLMKLVPQKEWTLYSHRIIHHGRTICQARKPACEDCGLARLCPKVGVLSPATR
jgi:endonuclease III